MHLKATCGSSSESLTLFLFHLIDLKTNNPILRNGKESACQCRGHLHKLPSVGWEDPLEEDMATHSSILAWRTPWTEESEGIQCIRSQRVGHSWSQLSMHTQHKKGWHTKIWTLSLFFTMYLVFWECNMNFCLGLIPKQFLNLFLCIEIQLLNNS